jgi:hypothetical protein
MSGAFQSNSTKESPKVPEAARSHGRSGSGHAERDSYASGSPSPPSAFTLGTMNQTIGECPPAGDVAPSFSCARGPGRH